MIVRSWVHRVKLIGAGAIMAMPMAQVGAFLRAFFDAADDAGLSERYDHDAGRVRLTAGVTERFSDQRDAQRHRPWQS